jgi:hypothetical protein
MQLTLARHNIADPYPSQRPEATTLLTRNCTPSNAPGSAMQLTPARHNIADPEAYH